MVAQVRARQTIAGAPLGAEALKVAEEAFDQAWLEIANHYTEEDIEAARFHLARSVVAVTGKNTCEINHVKTCALNVMKST